MKHFKYSAIILSLFAFQLLPAQTPEELRAWLPAIDGWSLSETEVFNPENLFDRINGAAPLFIENNFREMTSVDYKKGDDYITLQAYRHATPEDAFGMYASERSTELDYLPGIGGEAQGDAENLFFFAGNIYVKMSSHSETEVKQILPAIAGALSAKIDPQAGYPPILKAFPQKDKLPCSEAYITSSYIGHEFLRSVYTATYSAGGKTFQLFAADAGSSEGARDVLTRYFAFTAQPADSLREGELLIKDRYNGDIPAIWKGACIIGIYSESGDAIPGAEALLKEVAGKL
jgi:hypothetical protein